MQKDYYVRETTAAVQYIADAAGSFAVKLNRADNNNGKLHGFVTWILPRRDDMAGCAFSLHDVIAEIEIVIFFYNV